MARSSIGIALLYVGAVACSSSNNGTKDGQAPTISNLVVTNQPATVPVGQTTAFNGSLAVSDADGDAQSIQVSATAPGGSTTSPAPSQLQGASGQTSFAVNWSFAATPPTAGTYTVSLTVIDSEGQTSNALSFTQVAQ